MKATLQAVLTGEARPTLYRCASRCGMAALVQAATTHGWEVSSVDGRALADKAAFLSHLAEQLRFPAYFGHNWDAFEESLGDWVSQGVRPRLLIFDRAALWATAAPETFEIACEILQAACDRFGGSATPLAVLLRGAGRHAAQFPLLTTGQTR